jgi:diaminopimelate epimerase
VAAALVVDQREGLMLPAGRSFYKMSGSGNDFVFFDARAEPPGDLAEAGRIQRLCSRALGIGADGVVFLLPGEGGDEAAFRMRYHNSDGSLASLCGNAALCSTRLAVELGIAPAAGFSFRTDAGLLSARMRDGVPEIDLQPVTELAPEASSLVPRAGEERRIGFAVAGVPHVVVEVSDVAQVDLPTRGAELRHDRSLAAGANVNFVSRVGDAVWRMRTFERGVEGETLACGTGAVASAAVLRAWGAAGQATTIVTRSGRPLDVTLPADPSGHPALRGEGRLVFAGRLGELD